MNTVETSSSAQSTGAMESSLSDQEELQTELGDVPDQELDLQPPNADLGTTSTVRYLNGGSQGVDFFPPTFTPSVSSAPSRSDSFIATVKWKGTVAERNGTTFSADLEPILRDGSPKFAEIHLEDIPSEDQELVRPGATFYWSIGYLEKPYGTRIKASIIRFRRPPEWTQRELKKAKKEARRFKQLLLDDG